MIGILEDLILNITPPEILLLTLSALMVLVATIYKLKAQSDVSRLRSMHSGEDQLIKESQANEKSARQELQKFLKAQNMNASRISKLQRQKKELIELPKILTAELQELTAWCNRQNIQVDFERRQAARKAAPPGRRM